MKQFYSTSEAAEILGVTQHTLRFWEKAFPQFNPHRSNKGTRRYTPSDIELAQFIKSTLYDKGLKIDAAIEYVNKTYRKYPPRREFLCRNNKEAIALLDDIKPTIEQAHNLAKINSVIEFLKQSL